MVDLDSIERALLVNVVHQKRWNLLILNNITEKLISYPNKNLYNYIKDYTSKNTYPDLKAVCYKFEIDDDQLGEYLNVDDLQSLCNILIDEYQKSEIINTLNKINEKTDIIQKSPSEFINEFSLASNDLRQLGFVNKSVSILEDIDKTLQIDPNDVISTGFEDLDKYLIGWKRGEELVTFMARTGQGKSWMGLKFALHAALNCERVGIYSGEMSLQQLQERILCCAKPQYTSTKEDALKVMKDNDAFIKVLTQKELRRRATPDDIEEMIVRDELTMIIIDQLSLMDESNGKPGTPLRQQYGNISMDLFSLTCKYSLPCILLAQSNRSGGQQINGPQLENLAESDAVAQNSTRVISMKNESGILTMQLLKNRYGESGMVQKYEVDFGINKYRPIRDSGPETEQLKKAKARSMFGPGSGGKVF